MKVNLSTFLEKAYRKALKFVFGFDQWHISPLSERPYAQDIIRFCNDRSQKTVIVEIGCGLGDIIRNVDYKKRFGYDIDANVLRAARFMTWEKNTQTEYQVFDFPDSPLSQRADVVMLVNWIHHIEPFLLKEKLFEYFTNMLLPRGCLIIDTVGDPEYKFNHDIYFLTSGLTCHLEKIGDYERKRQVWTINKI